MEESKVLLVKKIFIENFDDYDIATYLVKEKFEEKHQKEKQHECWKSISWLRERNLKRRNG